MKRVLMTVMLLALAGGLGACNTMTGLGKDVQKLGDRIEDKASN